MISFPSAFEERMKALLDKEAEAFFQALQTEPPVSIRLNPEKGSDPAQLFSPNLLESAVPWCNEAWYLKERPVFTLDPCFHGGAYYVQEASSLFLHTVLKQILTSAPIKALDLCAAPGGKSTLTAALLPEGSLLVANEVIRSRAAILKENLIKWGCDHVLVTNNDPADFRPLQGMFDLILTDAPCSGEGMFRKDAGAVEEWSEAHLRLCSERQKRIITDGWESLKPGGYFIYSTCTYNPQENEHILEWMLSEFAAESIEIHHSFPGITAGKSNAFCYRFYPHKIQGEGFFIGVLRKTDGEETLLKKNKKLRKTSFQTLPREIQKLIRQPEKFISYVHEEKTGFIPAIQADVIQTLEERLRVIYKGCEAAEINNRKLRMLPALALYQGLQKENFTTLAADRPTALAYLRKEDIPLTGRAGEWILITYKDIALGWCKNLGNRLNNYYPKEWRIRMKDV